MVTKKPSLTKQIGEVLGTEDKREQLAKIEGLLQGANDPVVGVTVLFSKGDVSLSLVGEPGVSGENVKYILSLAIDHITKQMVRRELEQEQLDAPPLEGMEAKDPTGPQTGDTMANGDMTP